MNINEVSGELFYKYKDYAIFKESRCFTLYKKSVGINPKTREKTEGYTILGYFGTFNLALKKIVDDFPNGDISNPQAIINAIEKVYEGIKEVVNDYGSNR